MNALVTRMRFQVAAALWALCGIAQAGDLFVSSYYTHSILRYDGSTGAFLGTFVTSGSGGLSYPRGLTFGPDGNLYVASEQVSANSGTNAVLKYDGTTGAFLGTFVSDGSGGMNTPIALTFGPDGNLYVGTGGNRGPLKYNGST